jgi:hypothetical protein
LFILLTYFNPKSPISRNERSKNILNNLAQNQLQAETSKNIKTLEKIEDLCRIVCNGNGNVNMN